MALVEHETALHSDTAKRLRALAHLYELDQASSLMNQTLTKLMSFEAEQTRMQLETLQSDLLDIRETIWHGFGRVLSALSSRRN